MKKQLYINFLWHMHQPYYKDDLAKRYEMPWVFLHAIKDYYDMPWYLSKFASIKATFNLVPSLLVQLRDYENFDIDDKLLGAIKKEISQLSYDEKTYLLEVLFFAQENTMVSGIKRYKELLHIKKKCRNIDELIEVFSNNDILDLEVCFLLAWCGNYLRENSEIVKEFIAKRAFTHEDKITLLHELANFIKTIIPFYKTLLNEGKIEISATPFYHPILPLLIDLSSAKEANKLAVIPSEYIKLDNDAKMQINDAINYHKQIFQTPPNGFWPSEGSIDKDTLELLSQSGIKWACSDEDIIFKTLNKKERNLINKKYKFKTKTDDIYLMFRNRTLSDAIGFDYSRFSEKEAVEDFVQKLKNIHEHAEGSACVNVILDGENAWEFYKKNAKDFFILLYEKLESLDWCSSQTMSEAIKNEDIEEKTIDHIAAGSWINGDFAIWIGHPEKNRAWTLLMQTKKAYMEHKKELDHIKRQAIEKEFHIAEGSDWFWWFGDDHYTAQKGEFDYLFRKHLINIYSLLDVDIPSSLLKPIISSEKKDSFHKLPKNKISVIIDGKESSFFEWLGAGEVRLDRAYSVMDTTNSYIKKILYGMDDENIYIALKGKIRSLLDLAKLSIEFGDEEKLEFLITSSCFKNKITVCSYDFIEMSIPKSVFKKSSFDLVFSITKDNEILQSFPLIGTLTIEIDKTNSDGWYV